MSWNINCDNVLSNMDKFGECSINLIFSDPPYNLGSTVYVDSDGKMKLSKASDFMGKWKLDHEEWEQFFTKSFHVLKHGGFCALFSMDRQTALVKYYAIKAGFEEIQSLYWYQIQGFPKALDISKWLDNKAGADLAKKYDGYKGGIAAMKPCMETILVFRKPLLTGRLVDDILEYERGNKKVSPSVLNVDGERVEVSEQDKEATTGSTHGKNQQETYMGGWRERRTGDDNNPIEYHQKGRWPAQTYVNPEAAEAIDKQSGNLKSGFMSKETERKSTGGYRGNFSGVGDRDTYADSGGASRILHTCEFDPEELVFYCPKVSSAERNGGIASNKHPTLKPISLIKHLATLFKLPIPQKVYIPFCGTGSEVIGFLQAGYDDVEACEGQSEYVEIAKARIAHWIDGDKPWWERIRK